MINLLKIDLSIIFIFKSNVHDKYIIIALLNSSEIIYMLIIVNLKEVK